MIAVDLFAGWGGFTEGAEMAGVEVAWAANHWPLAVRAHAENHPRVQHECQDLRQADWTKLPAHDLLLAAPACVLPTAEIELADGTTARADSLQIGDVVLTHEGRGRPITQIWSKIYSGDLISIQVWGGTKKDLEMTSDHQVWVRRRGGHEGKLGDPEFVRADEVRTGDYVAFPRLTPVPGTANTFVNSRIPERVEYFARGRHNNMQGSKITLEASDLDLWWLLGHYLGDGEARRDRPQIGWSTGNSETNNTRVLDILRKFGLSPWCRGFPTNRRVFCSSTHLYALCSAFGRLSYTKSIPADLSRLEPEYVEALLEGYLAADGSTRARGLGKHHHYRATSTSLNLLQGLQRLAWRLGWSAGIGVGDYERSAFIEGRRVHCRPSWEICFRKTPHAQSRTKFTEGHVWRSVRSIEALPLIEQEVYDFEVAEDHTFCLPGAVVHNCQGHSSAARGARKANPDLRGRHDALRATAWSVVDCVEVCHPKAFIVENVVDFLSWNKIDQWLECLRIEGYRLETRVLCASEYGVPQRRHRVFVVGTLSGKEFPELTRVPEVPFGPCIEWDADSRWRPIDYRPKVHERVLRSRPRCGNVFLTQHTRDHMGVSLDEPIRTITTKDQWALVEGDRYRPLTLRENARAMGFRDTYCWPKEAKRKDVIKGLGNAVCPPLAKQIIEVVANSL